MPQFELTSAFAPAGDQPQAIAGLLESLRQGNREQTLLGVTGSGKTYTVAHLINELKRPTLVLSPNKTLAAQLWAEFREFFPHNAVEFFVSYYDYYQPEAYIPRTDTYIEKDSSRNEEIDRLRNSATRALLTRRDVIVVASVSCIYGIGSPENYLGSRSRSRWVRAGGATSCCASSATSSTAATTPTSGAPDSACGATCSTSSLPTRSWRCGSSSSVTRSS